MDTALRTELAAAEDRHWWFEGRRRILASVLHGLRLPPDARILEAGCGNGANLSLLARFGTVSAFEPFDDDRRRAEARGSAHVLHGSLPGQVPFRDERFDVVLALDVIEHVEDDRASLRELAHRLTPGGHLVVTVPAHPFLWSRHDVRNGHHRRYTTRSLLRVVRAAGLQPVRWSHFNFLLFPIVAAVRIAGRHVGADGAGTSVPPAVVNDALTTIFGLERRLIPHVGWPYGVSLLVVARQGL